MMKNKIEEYEKEDKRMEGKKFDIPLSAYIAHFLARKKKHFDRVAAKMVKFSLTPFS